MVGNGRLPRDMSLLRLQHEHITHDLWEGRERVLRSRRAGVWILNNQDIFDPRVINLMHQAGFGHALYIPDMDANHFLISSLLERWRSETHTFPFPHGETTVTLEDVAILLGLPIEGDVVTGPTTVDDIFTTFHEHLGVIPSPTVIRGNSIRVSWLNTTFQQLPPNANNEVIAQYTRAYILTLIGSILMPDTSAARVHVMYLLRLADLDVVRNYSWGSAVLACLYRFLDHGIHLRQENIGGCMILLQCWVWEMITSITPPLQPLSDQEVVDGDGFPVCRR